MRCYEILSNVFQLIHNYKDVITLSTVSKPGQLQGTFVFYCVISNSLYCGYICLLCGDQIFRDFVRFLSMIIYEVLYTCCLRYNICSAWFLDIRISTCSYCNVALQEAILECITDC